MSKRTTNSHKNFEEKDAFGRPINHSIELPFIQHLRKKKFPCINSESLVEICCNKYKPKVKRISSDSGEDNSLDTIRFLRNWFKKIDENYFG